jgi:hypothetical protein
MSHLSIERLAALADEQPTADELAHLSQCAACARERDAHRSLLAMAGSEREAMGLPLTRWDTLSERLRSEGLVAVRPVRRASNWGLQAAAALLLVAGGVALGRATTSEPVIPGTAVTAAKTDGDTLRSFASVEEALRWREIYSTGYQRTVAYLAANDSGSRGQTPAVMRARLAVMDQVSKTLKDALLDAPSDPVINDFYLNSFGQREATLRQLNNVLPQNVRLNSF